MGEWLTIKKRFTNQYIVPIQQECVRTMSRLEQVYELAKERYEAKHRAHREPILCGLVNGLQNLVGE